MGAYLKTLKWSGLEVSFAAKFMAAILMVVLADFLFYRHESGWTLGAFGFLCLYAFGAFNAKFVHFRAAYIIAALIAFQCLWMVEKPSLLSLFLIWSGIIALVVMRCGAQADNGLKIGLNGLCYILQIFHPANKAFDTLIKIYRRKKPVGALERVLRSWLLPVGASAVFLILFSSANPVMLKWFEGIDIIAILKAMSIWRVLFWLVFFALLMAIIRPRLKRRKNSKAEPKRDDGKGLINWLFTKEAVLRSLIIFNLLFALQSIMDMQYLFGGMSLPEGISYAEYAHKGAYPLIVTALLAAIFVLVTQNAGSDVSRAKFVQPLIYMWIGQNILLVFTSIYRTALYVDVYSLTYLRFAAFIWMGLVGCGLGWIILRSVIGKSGTWLVNANLITLFATLYIISFFNIGGFIAHYNVQHSREISGSGVPLDTAYLKRIGSASIPALAEYRRLTGRDMIILDNLIIKLDYDMRQWRRWNYREHRLLEELKQRKYSLEAQ